MSTYTIIGIATLLDENSARKTCPGLKSFRFAELPGYCRIFNKVDPFFEEEETKKIANVSIMPRRESKLIVSVFNISQLEWPQFIAREFEYKIEKIPFWDIESEKTSYGYGCLSQSEEEFIQSCEKCNIRQEKLKQFRQKYEGRMWQNDILPNDQYIKRCLDITANLGKKYIDNFLDHTYLADKKTTIREHLSKA